MTDLSTTESVRTFESPAVSPEVAPQPMSVLPTREPVVIIEPSSRIKFRFRHLWAYRELLYFLVWRDLKVRYKQAVLGMTWVIFQPLVMTIVFTVFLGLLARLPSDNVPYPLFAYAGLMLWSFFSGAVSSTGNSLVGNAPLITKVYFPRLIIPIASIVARLVDFAVALVILVGLMFYFRISLSLNMLMAPLIIILLALIALACGLWTSALNVKYRDIGIALPMLIQVWMFVSPVVYPMSMIPPKFRLLYSLNPLVGIIEGFRSSLFGTPFNWRSLIVAGVVTAILLVYGAYAFQSREKTFADVI